LQPCRKLYVVEISDKPGIEEAEPYLKIVGNVHGNEPLGRRVAGAVGLSDCMCMFNVGAGLPVSSAHVTEFFLLLLKPVVVSPDCRGVG
jgi:hypothetical protein